MFKSKSLIVNIFLPTIQFPKFAPKIAKLTFLYFDIVFDVSLLKIAQFLIISFHVYSHSNDDAISKICSENPQIYVSLFSYDC